VILLEAGGFGSDGGWCGSPGLIAAVHSVPQLKKRLDWGYYTVPQKKRVGTYCAADARQGCSADPAR